jgi:hypothetical protein
LLMLAPERMKNPDSIAAARPRFRALFSLSSEARPI